MGCLTLLGPTSGRDADVRRLQGHNIASTLAMSSRGTGSMSSSCINETYRRDPVMSLPWVEPAREAMAGFPWESPLCGPCHPEINQSSMALTATFSLEGYVFSPIANRNPALEIALGKWSHPGCRTGLRLGFSVSFSCSLCFKLSILASYCRNPMNIFYNADLSYPDNLSEIFVERCGLTWGWKLYGIQPC